MAKISLTKMDKDTVQKAQNLLQLAEATKYPDDLTALVQVLSDEMEDPSEYASTPSTATNSSAML